MSFTVLPPAWREFADKLLDRLPSPAVSGTVAAVLMLAIAGMLYGNFHGQAASYLVRLALPDAIGSNDSPSARTAIDKAQADRADKEADPALTQEGEAISGISNGFAFNDAFGDLVKKPVPKPGAFLPVDYNLAELKPVKADVDPSDGSLTVQKPLFVNGVSAGAATIRIESGAQILIATSSVAKALGDRADALPRRISNALAKGSGFIPFYELRGAGIQVEYDAARDRVSLSMPS